MKKILLATTMLVGTAGFAAAEVTLSGNARMGVVSTVGADGDRDFNFSSRARVAFALSGETDGGLSFGGSFRADNAGGAAAGTAGSVFVSGAFGKISMGDVTGAAEAVIGDLPEIGYTDIANNDITFIAGDGFNGTAPAVLYEYQAGALTAAVGLSDGNGGFNGTMVDPDLTGTALTTARTVNSADVQEFSVGVKYAISDAYSVSLGYEMVDYTDVVSAAATADASGEISHTIVGADATFGGVTLKAFYGKGGKDASDYKQYGLGVTYTADALTVAAFAKTDDDGVDKVTSYGIGGAYDLGGGASVVGGIGDDNSAGSAATVDLGLKFTF